MSPLNYLNNSHVILRNQEQILKPDFDCECNLTNFLALMLQVWYHFLGGEKHQKL